MRITLRNLALSALAAGLTAALVGCSSYGYGLRWSRESWVPTVEEQEIVVYDEPLPLDAEWGLPAATHFAPSEPVEELPRPAESWPDSPAD